MNVVSERHIRTDKDIVLNCNSVPNLNAALDGNIISYNDVIFDKDMLNLYEAGYSHIDWNQRMALGKSALAKWLHGFYATHAKPYPYKVETLHNLCGSVAAMKEFKRMLKKALDDLVGAGAIESWSIDQYDLVIVQRTPSKAQQKHLSQAAKRP